MDFYHYCRMVFDYVSCLIKLKKRKEARKQIFDLYFFIYPKMDHDGTKGRDFADNYRNVRDCASCLQRAEMDREAALFYIMSIVVLLDGAEAAAVWNGMERYVKGEWEPLLAAFSKVLHGTITANVDNIISVYEETAELLEKDRELYAFSAEFQWFSSVYQHQTIEFKRGR